MPKHTSHDDLISKPNAPDRSPDHVLEFWHDTDKDEIYISIGNSSVNDWKKIYNNGD